MRRQQLNNIMTLPEDAGPTALAFASAMTLLIDRLEASGALPEGDYQRTLRQTLSHPDVDHTNSGTAALHLLLGFLEVAPRASFEVVEGGIASA